MSATDEFVLAEHPPGATAPWRARTPLPVSRRASTWGIVGTALILVGVLVSPGLRAPSLDDGIAWNILELDLTTEPTVAWTADLWAGEALGHLDGVVVLSLGSEAMVDGEWPAPTLVGLDAETGSERWRIDDRRCLLGDALTCVGEPGSSGAHVMAVAADGSPGAATPHPGAMVARDLDDGGMLVLEGGSTALAELVRLDSRGAEVWRSRLSFSGLAGGGYWRLGVVGARVSTAGGWFDIASGEPLEWWSHLESASDGTLRETFEDGTAVVTLGDGRELHLPPDGLRLGADDSLGGPVALRWNSDGAIVATWDEGASTLTPLEGTACGPFARLQGTVVWQCMVSDGPGGVRTVAIDQLTGEQLWERAGGLSFGSMPATADTLVLSADGGVEGIDPRTGEPRWSVTVAGRFPIVTPIDDYLIVVTTEAVVRLG